MSDKSTNIYLEFNKRTYVTRTGSGEYDRDDTQTEWSLDQIGRLDDPKDYGFEVESVPGELKSGDKVYVVWVVYSTGDSFGRDDGYYKEVVGIYSQAELAVKCEKAIKSDAKLRSDRRWRDSTVKIKDVYVPTFDGTAMRKIYTESWHGYFETLDHVNISIVEVI